jgi:hypothetical protein
MHTDWTAAELLTYGALGLSNNQYVLVECVDRQLVAIGTTLLCWDTYSNLCSGMEFWLLRGTNPRLPPVTSGTTPLVQVINLRDPATVWSAMPPTLVWKRRLGYCGTT